MADITSISRTAATVHPLPLLRRLFSALSRLGRSSPGRLDTRTWSAYMLRDVGLRDIEPGADPRSLPADWLPR
jgi:hypothetical protein